MTKADIISDITSNSLYYNYCQKLCKTGDIYKDLYQHFVLCILETPEEKLIKIYEQGGLRSYFIRIIYLSVNSASSGFRVQYNFSYEDLKDRHNRFPDEEQEYNELLNKFDDEMEKECNACIQSGIYPFDVLLYREYEKKRNLSEVARCTQIPYKTVQRHIHSIRDKIVKKVNEDTSSNPA